MYGFSVFHCLPVGMAEQPLGRDRDGDAARDLRRYAHEAGFQAVDEVPVANDFYRFYCAHAVDAAARTRAAHP